MSVLGSLWSTAAFLAGLVLLFVGERLIGAGVSRAVVSSLGGAAVIAGLVLRALRLRRADAERRAIERTLLAVQAIGVLGLVVYLAQSDLVRLAFGRNLDQLAPKLSGALAALWPALVALSGLPLLLAELAHASMARSPMIEKRRVQEAALSGVGLAAVLVFAFCAVYVAGARDPKWDLSYFRATRPGSSTVKIVESLGDKDGVTVSLFFPPGNEVHDQVKDYFDLLARGGKHLKIEDDDFALEPKRAHALGVSGNGAVVLAHGTRHEQIFLGTDLSTARTDLMRFDREVQKHLLELTRGRKVVYLTAGHGERSNERAGADDQRARLTQLYDVLAQQSLEVHRLGAAEGLGAKVPDDAAAVLVIGPTRDFLPEEAATLEKYLHDGGHVLFALDPDAHVDTLPLLKSLGIDFVPEPTANDRMYLRRDYQLTDRLNLATASFSSHPSVTTLSQLGSRAPVVMVDAGHLASRADRPKDVSIDFTVFAQPDSWNDLDGNFEFGAPHEVRKAWPLAAAVSLKPAKKGGEGGRALVFADSDAFADGILQNPGNAYLALDGIRWLTHQEALAGETSSEDDVPVMHTRSQDLVWFYSTIFIVPALVLGAGFGVTRRKRRAKR